MNSGIMLKLPFVLMAPWIKYYR